MNTKPRHECTVRYSERRSLEGASSLPLRARGARSWLRLWAMMALAVGLFFVPMGDAVAQNRPARPAPAAPAPVSGKVAVEVMVAYAHNEDRRVDPELRGVMAALKHFRFSGYRLLEKHPAQLAPGQSSSFNVPGGKKLRLDLLDRNETRARLRVRMFKGNEKVLDTTVSIHRNKTFMIGGPPYKQGNLVLPVTVRY